MSKVSPADVRLVYAGEDGAFQNLNFRRSHFLFSRIANKPWKWFSFMLGGQLLGIIISLILYGANYSLFPTQFGIVDIDPSSSSVFPQDLAWTALKDDATNNLWTQKMKTVATRSVDAMPIQLIYKSSKGNCLTKTNLRAMQQLEALVMNNTEYIEFICQKQSDGSCRKPRSILSFFDGTYQRYNIIGADSLNVFRADPNFDRIAEIISLAYEANGHSDSAALIAAGQPDLQSALNYNLGSDFNNFAVTSSLCRSMMYSGLPLSGYRTDKHSTDEQLASLGQLQGSILGDFLKDRSSMGDLELFYQSTGIEKRGERMQRTIDYYLAIGSIIFLGLAIWFQTTSLWIAINTLIGALGSFVWANLVYRIVLNFYSFSDPQALSGFVVALLCSAHTVYLLHLFRKASETPSADEKDTGALLSTAMLSGHRTVLTTCLVMSLAFFVSAASSFKIVLNFSVFNGLLCLSSYLTIVFFTPTVFATWHITWSRYSIGKTLKRLCFCKKPSHEDNNNNNSSNNLNNSTNSTLFTYTKLLENFFRGKYVDYFVGNGALRWLIISASLIIVAAFLIAAAVRLRTDNNQPVLWRGHTNFGSYHKYRLGSFGQSDQDRAVRLYLLWGLDAVDDHHCHRSDLNCHPLAVYDDAFDLDPHTSQRKLLEFCNALKSVDIATERNLHIRRSATVDPVTGDNPLEIKCFISAQQTFFNKTASPLPFTLQNLASLVASNPSLYPANVYSAVGSVANPYSGTYYRAYEMSTLHWLSNASTATFPSTDYVLYSDLFGGTADSTSRRNSNSLTYAGNYGDSIRYAAIQINLTIGTYNQDLSEARSVRRAWDDYLTTSVSLLPPTLQSLILSSPETLTFTWIDVQQGLVNSLFRGIILGLMFLWLGVLVASGNWVLATISTVTSLWTVFIVFGIAAFSNWNLGVSESLVFVLIVPLSTIPIVYLSLAFRRILSDSRRFRLSLALAEAGPPVLFAGFIGIGISVFLFGAQLSFNFQFGVLFFSSIGISCVLVLVYMAAFMGVGGPRGIQGRLWGRAQERVKLERMSVPELIRSDPTPADKTVAETNAGGSSV